MGDPKTVREWLEMLPEPYRTSAIEQQDDENARCRTLSDALLNFREWKETREGLSFWKGFRWFVLGRTVLSNQDEYAGYVCAKAAFEAQQLPNPETLPDVTYIPVSPDDHAELVRKAALCDKLKAVIDRLDCELQDIKRLFV